MSSQLNITPDELMQVLDEMLLDVGTRAHEMADQGDLLGTYRCESQALVLQRVLLRATRSPIDHAQLEEYREAVDQLDSRLRARLIS